MLSQIGVEVNFIIKRHFSFWSLLNFLRPHNAFPLENFLKENKRKQEL